MCNPLPLAFRCLPVSSALPIFFFCHTHTTFISYISFIFFSIPSFLSLYFPLHIYSVNGSSTLFLYTIQSTPPSTFTFNLYIHNSFFSPLYISFYSLDLIPYSSHSSTSHPYSSLDSSHFLILFLRFLDLSHLTSFSTFSYFLLFCKPHHLNLSTRFLIGSFPPTLLFSLVSTLFPP